MSYSLAPRAKIFRRDHAKVSTFEDFKDLMRENNYKTDPYSENSPFNAICSRGSAFNHFPISHHLTIHVIFPGDLNSPPSLGGCYDGKVTSFDRALMMKSEAVNGPTRGSNNEYP